MLLAWCVRSARAGFCAAGGRGPSLACTASSPIVILRFIIPNPASMGKNWSRRWLLPAPPVKRPHADGDHDGIR